MNQSFCTIITADYFPKALTLLASIRKFSASANLHVLVADEKEIAGNYQVPAGLNVMRVGTLNNYKFTQQLYNKYAHTNTDYFRWSMKPILVSYLLEHGHEKLLYIDCDMYFFNNYNFLFDMLEQHAVLLTPNWINSDPGSGKESFFSVFTSGFFSAGFIGANRRALEAMNWWAEACHFMMGEHISHGIRDDQKYLDLFPIKYEETKIVRHRGCNIGAWNLDECKRTLVNGEVLINGEYPIIFIHFDGMLVQGILRGYDKLLLPYLEEYKASFAATGANLEEFISEIKSNEKPGLTHKLKWQLRLKTRFKKFLYRLSQKL